jgi:hypothetical protein
MRGDFFAAIADHDFRPFLARGSNDPNFDKIVT